MMKSFPISPNPSFKKVGEDPLIRLTLAVRELDKLINRANQLAHLSEQPFPTVNPTHPDQATSLPKT